jgi:hypothetical protein
LIDLCLTQTLAEIMPTLAEILLKLVLSINQSSYYSYFSVDS